MTDMHTHILYGVDDGADSREISNYLLTQARQNGIERIVLTPHQNEELKRSEELKERFRIFKEEFKDFNIDFYLGSEIYYYDSMIKDLDNKELLTINDTKYILVEFSTRMETDIASIIYDLIVRGYKPIVAHIERYHYLELKDYDDIKKNGALIQVNSKSFLNKAYKKQLKYLLKNKLIDFISSDCHNKTRDLDFTDSKKLISKKYKDQYDKLFNEIPEFIK